MPRKKTKKTSTHRLTGQGCLVDIPDLTEEDQPSSGLMALFENARPVNEIDREGFARDVRKLMDKPSFKAGVIKDQFIHNILEALDEEGISQSELARRWGKSRLRRCAPRGGGPADFVD